MRASLKLLVEAHAHAHALVRRVVLLLVLLLVLAPRMALAGDDVVAGFVGASPSGLPGIGRVAVASPRASPHVAAGLSAGYGITESLAGESSAHHRAFGVLGLAAQPVRFLSAALMLDGRFDKHPDDVLGSSSSTVGEPRLLVRGAKDVARSVAIGGQLGLLMPGTEAPSLRPEASTIDANVLFTFAPSGSDLAVAFNGGYRIDRTSELVERRTRLRTGDRLTLHASDSNAVLLGLGVSKRLRRLEVLGDVGWDLLVGEHAPSAIESPLRAGAGVRYHLTDDTTSGLQLELRSEVALGERAGNLATDRLAPIEPRFATLAGLRYVLPFGKKAETPVAATSPTRPSSPDTTRPVAMGSMRGRVTGERGEPVAKITVQTSDGRERAVDAGADGSFAMGELPPGATRVTAKAAGYEDATVDVTIDRTPSVVDLVLKRTVRPGQLRGLVRSFDGRPLAATIRVEPLGIEAKTDADGAFQVDVPPGAYQVVVGSKGYAEQRRPVQVEENGVTILNADLRRGQ